jgi:5'-methylthioadenosine phosphorylase
MLSLGSRKCSCSNALESALITDKSKVPAETYQKLELIVGKYFAK